MRTGCRRIISEEPADIPENIQPSASTTINFETDKAEPVVVEEKQYYPEPGPEPDEATAALMRQLQHLRASEQAQKDFAAQVAAQRAAQMAAPAPTLPAGREERIALWRTHGLTDDDAAFLEANPELIDNPRLTRVASDEAEQQGHERGTEAHRQATREIFDRHLGHQQAQPAASARPAAVDPGRFFEPPEPSRSPAAAQERPGAAAYVSAPVSKREAGGHRELSPSQVRLSAAEVEMAKASGVTERQYAEGKLRMMKLKALGEIP